MNKKPELLAPAGDMTSLEAALDAGADAVYLGLETLNMRIRSGVNFTRDTLPEASRRCRERAAKLYLTLNSIVFEDELGEMEDTVAFARPFADAVIAADFATFGACRRHGVPFHVSTQMSCSNSAAASFFRELGASRVVLARECTLEEVARIAKTSGIEVETFVHGAQCVAVSGRCFLSHHAYGKSACRGECRQPCRRQFLVQSVDRYTGKPVMPDGTVPPAFVVTPHTVMSAKDLCSLPYMTQMVEAGIASFKIEGRARNPEYVHTVVSAYREALDAVLAGRYDKALCERLTEKVSRVFRREFSFGMFHGRPGHQQFTDFEDSIATTVKRQLGIVRNYYAAIGIAEVEVQDRPLVEGSTIQIHGPTTGVIELEVPELRLDGARAERAVRGETATFKCPRCRIGDKVFSIENVNRGA